MVPNRNFRIHNAFTLGSPLPTLACPYCLRHFRSRGGRTKHIRARHPEEGSNSAHGPNLSVPLSPTQSLHSQPLSPIPSDMIPPRQFPPQSPPNSFPPDTVPPSHGRPDSAGPDNETSFSDLGHAPPGPYPNIGDEMNREPSLGGRVNNQDVPDPSRVTRIYHPKLDGKSRFFLVHTNANFCSL